MESTWDVSATRMSEDEIIACFVLTSLSNHDRIVIRMHVNQSGLFWHVTNTDKSTLGTKINLQRNMRDLALAAAFVM